MNSLAAMAEADPAVAAPSARPRAGSPRAITDFFDIGYLLSVARRRFLLVVLCAVPLSALGLFIAFVLPATYRSAATILVESQQIPSELARSTVTASAIEQIQVIEQRLMTRETLLELAAKHGVFADQPMLSPTEQVDRMRQTTGVDLITFNRSGSSISTAVAFTVSFTARDPRIAAAVANDLVTRILDQNTRLRRQRAETTSAFFRQEVDRLSRELDTLGAEIVRFQKENEAALPDNLDYRRSQLDLIQERLERFQIERAELEREKGLLELTLEEGVVAGDAGGAIDRELEALRRQLVQRRAILNESHPEVRALVSSIAALEASLAATPPQEPAAAPRSAREAEIATRIAVNETRMQVIDAQLAALEDERERIERSILDTPNVEMTINALRRGYADLETEYQAAQAKLAQASVGERLEDRQQAERFEVIEQPTVPEKPQSPNRLRIVAMGIVAGLGAGGGLAGLLELMSRVVRRPQDLEAIALEAISVIPYVDTPGERLRRWVLRIAGVAIVVGGVGGALWLAHTHYLPLEVIAQKIVEKARLEEPIDLIRRRLGL